MKRYFLSALSISLALVFFAGWVYIAYANTAGPNLTTNGTNNAAIGTVAWSSPTNISACDSTNVAGTATQTSHAGSPTGGGAPFDSTVELVNSSGTISGNNEAKNTTLPATTLTNVNYGGTSDLWGETWTSSSVNSSNFGIVESLTGNAISTIVTNYLEAQGFGFTIPTGSTINGIQATFSEFYNPLVSTLATSVDCVTMTVTYTLPPVPSPRVQIRTGRMVIHDGHIVVRD